ncbi:ATP/GTP-binding protein [Brachyspira sp. SAP_772]|uniref:AAA family ATPase n=1 Tax=Brachyspira sp. SAP_772 TaxID=2608385 RepID=UPI0012F4FB89|nr:AAA family ATPase [Brachyspira sp. SAP_772]
MIKNFEIRNYRQFKNSKFDNFANVNLFAGDNDTGKTTILKFLYSITHQLKNIKNNNIRDCNIFQYINNLYDFNNFQFDTSNKPTDKLKNLYLYDGNTVHFNVSISNSKNETITSNDKINGYNYDYKPLFIPAKEILSIMNAVIYLKNQNIGSGFDDSYTDIIYEIFARKNIDERELLSVFNNRYDFYNGNIQIDKNTVNYYKNDGNIYNINIMSEGIKRLGIFEVLYSTGNLTKKSILFIDEPENSLDPKMLRELMRFLVDISKEGVQIFMASDDSSVLTQLSHIALKENYSINSYFFIKEYNYTKIDGPYDISKTCAELK